METSAAALHNIIIQKEVQMSPQPITQQVRWQDLSVRNEVEVVLEIAHQMGWKDCEVFGHGSMITQPQESMSWKLIPADIYEYSIPAEGAARVHRVINAGVRIQGVIIADDGRIKVPQPANTHPVISLPSVKIALVRIAKLLLGLAAVAAAIVLALWIAHSPIVLLPLILLTPLIGMAYDPKLIILVDDGNGGTVWVSLFTWYE